MDTSNATETTGEQPGRIDWVRAVPFALMHLACIAVIWVGVSWTAVVVATALYAVRMFAITAFYHRYFSHRTFQASRPVQFVFAVIGASSVQRGPLWWAAHHRHHHRHADQPLDPHSPREGGFWRSHMGWFLTREAFATDLSRVPDLARFPELRWLDRFDTAIPVLLAVGLYALGAALERWAPGLHTTGPQLLVWGFFISTIVLFHATVTINSLAHRFGRRRFETRDDSRNNLWLALLTFGEGWHNNHHFFPGTVRQGFRWWEVDLTWYGLRAMAALGLVKGSSPSPSGFWPRRGTEMRIAVIGSGIAGLASAWWLDGQHDVTLFEANDYLGGHTHTHDVQVAGRGMAVDTGFIVFNPQHYPLLSALFDELGVASQPTTMSFPCTVSAAAWSTTPRHWMGCSASAATWYRRASGACWPTCAGSIATRRCCWPKKTGPRSASTCAASAMARRSSTSTCCRWPRRCGPRRRPPCRRSRRATWPSSWPTTRCCR